MKVDIIQQLPPNFRNDVIKDIIKIYNAGESCTITLLPGSGKHRIARHICFNKEFKSAYFPNNAIYFVEAQDQKSVEEIKSKLQDSSIFKKGDLIVVNDIDQLTVDSELLKQLQVTKRRAGLTISIICFNSNLDFINRLQDYPAYDFLAENLFFYKPNTYEDNNVFFIDKSESYGLQLSEPNLKEIQVASGGNQTIAYEMIRMLDRNEITLKQLDSYNIIFTKSKIIQNACKEIIDHIYTNFSEDTCEKLGLYDKNGYYTKFLDIYENYSSRTVIESFLKNSIPLLSEREDLLLAYFIRNYNKIISKETIARIIWKQDWLEKYSEWALEKLIEEIRKKIADSECKILTKKGRGYYFTKV